MTNEINNLLTLIECTLINFESPDYLEISAQNNYFYILCSKRDYKNVPLSERIRNLFDLLEFEHSDIIKNHPIIIETLDQDELTDLMRFYNEKV